MIKNWLIQRHFDQRVKVLNNSELSTIYQPPVVGDKTFAAMDFCVLDFETTGLNPKKDRVLSAGWTTIENQRVEWGACEHHLIQHTQSIPDQSVAIHHITEQEAAQGKPIEDIFPHILKQLSDKVLVAHFADIEVGFLQQLAKQLYAITLPLVVIDTLQLAFAMKYKHAVHVPQNALNLFSLREQYELPRYKAHNALSDAVATAELLVVLVHELSAGNAISTAKILSLMKS